MKEVGDVGTDIKRIVPDTPGLQGRSGNLELLGSLTLGETLSSQLPVLLKEVRTFESSPAWLAPMVDLGPVLDGGSHRDLPCPSLDVRFISPLPVMQRPACMAWADKGRVQIVWAEG